MDNLKAKKRHPEEIAVYTAIYVCAAFSVLLLLGIIIYVFAKGARRVNWAFLTGVTSILHGTVGIAGNILNTLIIILLTMIITTPIGVGAAIYLNEYASYNICNRDTCRNSINYIWPIWYAFLRTVMSHGIFTSDRFSYTYINGASACYKKYTGSVKDCA